MSEITWSGRGPATGVPPIRRVIVGLLISFLALFVAHQLEGSTSPSHVAADAAQGTSASGTDAFTPATLAPTGVTFAALVPTGAEFAALPPTGAEFAALPPTGPEFAALEAASARTVDAAAAQPAQAIDADRLLSNLGCAALAICGLACVMLASRAFFPRARALVAAWCRRMLTSASSAAPSTARLAARLRRGIPFAAPASVSLSVLSISRT